MFRAAPYDVHFNYDMQPTFFKGCKTYVDYLKPVLGHDHLVRQSLVQDQSVGALINQKVRLELTDTVRMTDWRSSETKNQSVSRL